MLNDKDAYELAELPQRAQDDIREYFHGVCLNVHGFTEHICSNGFAEKLKSCASDEQKHSLLNVALSQKVLTATEVLNHFDVIAGEIGADLDRNWSKLCGQLNDSWKLTLKSATPADQRLDLTTVTEETILQSLDEARSRAYPLGQHPAISQPISEIGMAAILLLPVAVAAPEVAFPLFLVRAMVSAWSYVLGRLAYPAADYQLAITEHLAILGNRVAVECEKEVRHRIADLHTFQQQAIELPAANKVNQIVGAELAGVAYGMKRVTQADQPFNLSLVGDHAGDPAAHRLAADDQMVAAESVDHFSPSLHQHWQLVGRPTLP